MPTSKARWAVDRVSRSWAIPTDDKIYTYREFNSWGEFTDSKGSVDGDTWTWTNDEKMGNMTMKGRSP